MRAITMGEFLSLVELSEDDLLTPDGRKLHADGIGWDKRIDRHLMRLSDPLPYGEDILVRAGKHLFLVNYGEQALEVRALTSGGKSCSYNVPMQLLSPLA